mmetsp:Transcript_22952/g.53037  ORF Transcript_22952/g.53037 Transcript_22952/m.53037 type:complete len:257 (-) Transcript_22952:5-775(-)
MKTPAWAERSARSHEARLATRCGLPCTRASTASRNDITEVTGSLATVEVMTLTSCICNAWSSMAASPFCSACTSVATCDAVTVRRFGSFFAGAAVALSAASRAPKLGLISPSASARSLSAAAAAAAASASAVAASTGSAAGLPAMVSAKAPPLSSREAPSAVEAPHRRCVAAEAMSAAPSTCSFSARLRFAEPGAAAAPAAPAPARSPSRTRGSVIEGIGDPSGEMNLHRLNLGRTCMPCATSTSSAERRLACWMR